MKKSLILVVFAVQLISGRTIRKYSNEFLNIGVDASAFGMGKVGNALYSNIFSIKLEFDSFK